MIYKKLLFFVLQLIGFVSIAQITEVQNHTDSLKVKEVKQLEFNAKKLIIPSVLIGYGVAGLFSNDIKSLNVKIRDHIVAQNHDKTTIDNYMQYVPAASVYVLGAVGIKGKNSLRDKTIILATATLIAGLTVSSLKTITKVERPDGSADNSFPSGHTANAFMGAEFLYQEYKESSMWYGVSGYIVATSTGVLRMYNNRHWLTDVAAGAGIGILSTKAAYWLYPTINKIFTPKNTTKKKNNNTVFIPYYDGKQLGFGLVSVF